MQTLMKGHVDANCVDNGKSSVIAKSPTVDFVWKMDTHVNMSIKRNGEASEPGMSQRWNAV